MKILLSSLILAATIVCQAQSSGTVPKPPWAGGSKQSSPKSDSPAGTNDSTFKVDVKLVNIFVTVTDDRGAPVGNLSKDNFQVLEDDHPQKISVFGKES